MGMFTRLVPAVVLAVCIAAPAPAADSPLDSVVDSDSLVHQAAPVFVRDDLHHHRVDLGEMKGKVILLNFWATWCAPCQVEMPRFAEWQRVYGARGLQVIAVSMDDDAAPVRAYERRHPAPFPVLMGDAQLGRMYGGVLGLPATFLIDRRGMVAAHFKGAPHLGRMEAEVRRLLDQP